MTSSERQRRYLAKLAASKPAPPAPPRLDDGLVIRVEHLRRFPGAIEAIAPLLCQRLGHDATRAFVAALNRVLEPPDQDP